MRNEFLEELAIDLAYEGKDYDTIKSELKRRTNDSELISAILLEVDNHIVQYQLMGQEKSMRINKMIAVCFVSLLGAGFVLFSNFLETGKLTVSFGALLLGAWVFKREYDKYYAIGERGSYKNSKFKRKKFIR